MTIPSGPIPANTVAYPGIISGFPVKVCQTPQEGPRIVALMIDFNKAPISQTDFSVFIDLTRGNVNPLSQIVLLNVDNTSNNFATEFIFPDTGFRTVCPPLTATKLPVITNNLQFYAVNTGSLSNKSICNIHVQNFNQAGFEVNENIPGVNYVVNSSGEIIPLAVADLYSSVLLSFSGSGTVASNLIIVDKWVLTSFDIVFACPATSFQCLVEILDGVTPVWQAQLIGSPNVVTPSIFSQNNLQLVSNSNPSNKLIASATSITITTYNISFNAYYTLLT